MGGKVALSVSLSSPRSFSRDGNSVARRGGRKSLPTFLSSFSLFWKLFLSLFPLSFLSLQRSPLSRRKFFYRERSLSPPFLPLSLFVSHVLFLLLCFSPSLSLRLLATEITSIAREPQGELCSLFVLSLFSHPSFAGKREK